MHWLSYSEATCDTSTPSVSCRFGGKDRLTGSCESQKVTDPSPAQANFPSLSSSSTDWTNPASRVVAPLDHSSVSSRQLQASKTRPSQTSSPRSRSSPVQRSLVLGLDGDQILCVQMRLVKPGPRCQARASLSGQLPVADWTNPSESSPHELH